MLPLRVAANPALACTPPGSSLSRGFSSSFYYMIDYQAPWGMKLPVGSRIKERSGACKLGRGHLWS